MPSTWHAIGHESLNGFKLKPSTAAVTVKYHEAYMEWLLKTSYSQTLSNAFLELLVPVAFKAYVALQDKVSAHVASSAGLDPALRQRVHHGLSIAWNRATALHRDTRGPIGDYTLMMCLEGPDGKHILLPLNNLFS